MICGGHDRPTDGGTKSIRVERFCESLEDAAVEVAMTEVLMQANEAQ